MHNVNINIEENFKCEYHIHEWENTKHTHGPEYIYYIKYITLNVTSNTL